jgi:hypothetical protein
MLRTFFRTFLVWTVLLHNLSQAQDIRVTDDSQTEIRSEVGKLVTMTVKDDEVMAAEWIVAVGPEDSFAVSETGKFSYFAVPKPGKYIFVLAYISSDLKIKAKKFVVLAGDQQPDTPSKLPDGKYKLAQFAYDCCKKLGPTEKQVIAKMANNYAMIRLKSFTTPQELINATRDGNREAVKDADPAKMQAVIFDPLTAIFKQLQLKTIDELLVAWGELALGYDAWAKE